MQSTDPNTEVFVSSNSEGNPYHPGDRETLYGPGLYCETVVKTKGKLLVANALADPKWEDNPDIKLNMISCLGFPLFWPTKRPFGTVFVLDDKPHEYSQANEALMLKLRSQIESHLETIHMNHVFGDKNRRLINYLDGASSSAGSGSRTCKLQEHQR